MHVDNPKKIYLTENKREFSKSLIGLHTSN